MEYVPRIILNSHKVGSMVYTIGALILLSSVFLLNSPIPASSLSSEKTSSCSEHTNMADADPTPASGATPFVSNPASPLRAVVLGPTGATGREVVRSLLNRNWQVTAVTRRNFTPPEGIDTEKVSKLTQVISEDLDDKQSLVEKWRGHDALFNCLGTTRGAAGSAEAFVHVEVGLTRKAVDIAKEAGIPHASVVSAMGANKDAWVPSTYIHPMLYARTLGEKQQAMIDGGFPSLAVFQPGMLDRLVGDRAFENLIVKWIPSIVLRVDHLAQAMVLNAEREISALKQQLPAQTAVGDATCAAPKSKLTIVHGNDNIRAMSGL